MGNWNNIHHTVRPSHKLTDHIPQSISLAGQLILSPNRHQVLSLLYLRNASVPGPVVLQEHCPLYDVANLSLRTITVPWRIPVAPNFGAIWKWQVCFMTPLLCPKRSAPHSPVSELGGSQSQNLYFGSYKNLLPLSGIEKPFLHYPALP